MSEWRVLGRHAATVLVGQLAIMAFGVADTIIAGRHSVEDRTPDRMAGSDRAAVDRLHAQVLGRNQGVEHRGSGVKLDLYSGIHLHFVVSGGDEEQLGDQVTVSDPLVFLIECERVVLGSSSVTGEDDRHRSSFVWWAVGWW